MFKFIKISAVVALASAALTAGLAQATIAPSSAVVIERVFNDSFASILTVNNSYPGLIDINDEASGPLGWANLHVWRFSSDGVTAQQFDNTDGFAFFADVTISGTGNGEAGLQIAPWWSPNVDGRFNVRTTDGEVACFGGRLPFYSFTGSNGVHYVKGTTVHMGMIYTPNVEMTLAMPATIEYIYDDGTAYSSGPIAFDEGNPFENPPHGVFGILSPAYVGGHMQFNDMAGSGAGSNLNATWSNIVFQDLGTVVGDEDTSWGNVKSLFR